MRSKARAIVVILSMAVLFMLAYATCHAGAGDYGEIGTNRSIFTDMWGGYMEKPANRTCQILNMLGRGGTIVDTVFIVELAEGNFTFNWEINSSGWYWGEGNLTLEAPTVFIDTDGAKTLVAAYLEHENDLQTHDGLNVTDHLGRVMAVLRAFSLGLYTGHVVPDGPSWSPPLLDLLGSAEYLEGVIDEGAQFNLNIFLDGQTDVLDLGVLGRFDLSTMRYTNAFLEGAMVVVIFAVSLWLLRLAHINRRGM